MTPYVARWDLDKTYLRSDFDTLRDLVRTALERPSDKRTVPGASAVMREIAASGARIHILSGSPRQMRRILEAKLRLDGVRWDALTLKPNLENLLKLRWRALRDQLGYKLPALLGARAGLVGGGAGDEEGEGPGAAGVPEVLFGDDAEADAFVYSLYLDVVRGAVSDDALEDVLVRGRVYGDQLAETLRLARLIGAAGGASDAAARRQADVALIHLDRQSSPREFTPYGARVVPFYNYLQAAFVLHERGRLPPESVLRVAAELVLVHRFDGDSLARSYLDLVRRGGVTGAGAGEIADAIEGGGADAWRPARSALEAMCDAVDSAAPGPADPRPPNGPTPAVRVPDYASLVAGIGRRRRS